MLAWFKSDYTGIYHLLKERQENNWATVFCQRSSLPGKMFTGQKPFKNICPECDIEYQERLDRMASGKLV